MLSTLWHLPEIELATRAFHFYYKSHDNEVYVPVTVFLGNIVALMEKTLLHWRPCRENVFLS